MVEGIKLKSLDHNHDCTGYILEKRHRTVIPLTIQHVIDHKSTHSCKIHDEYVASAELPASDNGDESSDSDYMHMH